VTDDIELSVSGFVARWNITRSRGHLIWSVV